MLAVVALSYEEEAEITQEERKKELVDHREDSTFSFDPSSLNVKKLQKHKIKKIDARKGVLLSSYTRKRTRRRKRNRSTTNPGKQQQGSGGGTKSEANENNKLEETAGKEPSTKKNTR
ncbi:hypothetical protein HHI36_003114 [Cryptolaemus montrouzieri]|uniref:Uncharacterized protein n=1 Tax=Cryptolaemus montrouzieri TaxID=559131 RepID=A0ABD2PDF6_9CUCU